ncbi:hypothetical protein C8024_00050 [Sphingopyxis sp. BSNA05]|nr:hypothetical protein [Sphingopyxis sp. BSNA05]|tara:strand:- start:4854 stop:5135 length:282 start_codon:yes stop_codon:yes gene_type:complete
MVCIGWVFVMSDQFADLIQVLAAAFGFCAFNTGVGGILPSRRSGIIGIWSEVMLTDFAGFALFAIGSDSDICQFLHCSDLAGPRPARSLRMAW